MRYNEVVMDHFMNPRNVGAIDDADAIGEIGDDGCGDVVKIYLRIEGGRVQAASFETLGCATSIAASSMATVLLEHQTWERAALLTAAEINDALGGLPDDKKHCAVLAERAVKAALRQYFMKKQIAYNSDAFAIVDDSDAGERCDF
ncbi:MAG: iron-sulfur cluster assembly scaffold protein [Ruminococcus sp.]|nr:iron-sulfur cluster assembly scaffold protein [Ruminococcus sp.]